MARVQASFGTFKFWALSASGPDGRRIIKHQGWGRNGPSTEDTGSDGRHERITAELTEDEYLDLRTLCHKAEVKVFNHPLLGSWRARVNIPNRSVDFSNVDRIQVELEFIEDTDQPPASPYDDETPAAKISRARSLYDDVADIMTASDSPGNTDTATNWATFQTSWSAFDAQADFWDDAESDWQDVEKALDQVKTDAVALVEDLQAFTTFQEGASEVTSNLMRCLHTSHEYIDAIKQQGKQWYAVQANALTDLYTICLQVYGHTDNVDQILSRNNILDSFYIDVGTTLEFPF
jgi:prophage DNA circulation protein